jgi:hypothetical protein
MAGLWGPLEFGSLTRAALGRGIRCTHHHVPCVGLLDSYRAGRELDTGLKTEESTRLSERLARSEVAVVGFVREAESLSVRSRVNQKANQRRWAYQSNQPSRLNHHNTDRPTTTINPKTTKYP